MTRNQKIALGCGGAGCLGLIVVVIAGALIYFFTRSPRSTRNYNFNVSTNRNSNSNDNSDFSTNTNSNSNTNENANASNSNSSQGSDSSLSDDDKHKLYQAAIQTGDQELIRRVSVKIGVMDADYTPGSSYQQFVSDHVDWVMKNTDFLGTINSPEKARAYVNEHFPE